jgi:DASS family divalent anion:Na+ symporter
VAEKGSRGVALRRLAALALALLIWICPPPTGLGVPAWHLFALFAAAIVSVVIGALPILTAAIFAGAAAVLTGTVPTADAWAGFSSPTILLIVIAFLVARAVVTSGLGQRLGYLAIAVFGRSTLGLSYSIFLVDAVIAPAFPSNTARSGVLYPLAVSVAEGAGATPGREDRRRLGRFLMFSGIASLSLSSGLWLTAMAANPLGADIARSQGASISFASWLIAASVPTLAGIVLLPLALYKVIRPEVTATPEAPREARRALQKLGPMSAKETIVALTFAGMVLLWGMASILKVDSTAVAFLGLGILLATGALTLEDISKEGDVLATFIWFAVLYALSDQLNKLGFMEFLGGRLAMRLGGLPPFLASLLLVIAYVAIHYLFVSQTAHLLALFGVFLGVGVKLGVPAAPLALQLLFATNYFSALTPQGSSANLLFAGSGYLSQGDLYRLGAFNTAFCLVLYLAIGTPWLMLVAR